MIRKNIRFKKMTVDKDKIQKFIKHKFQNKFKIKKNQ